AELTATVEAASPRRRLRRAGGGVLGQVARLADDGPVPRVWRAGGPRPSGRLLVFRTAPHLGHQDVHAHPLLAAQRAYLPAVPRLRVPATGLLRLARLEGPALGHGGNQRYVQPRPGRPPGERAAAAGLFHPVARLQALSRG